MKSARLGRRALGVVAAALAAASTTMAAAQEKLPALKDVARLTPSSGAAPVRKTSLPLFRPIAQTVRPGDAARKVISLDPRMKLSSLPTLIAGDADGWAARDAATGQGVGTYLSSADSGPGVIGLYVLPSSGGIVPGQAGTRLGWGGNSSVTFHQIVSLAPGQQYLVEIAMQANCSGQMTMKLPYNAGSLVVPYANSGQNEIHVFYNYTYPQHGSGYEDLAFTLAPASFCQGQIDSIAYVPFAPVN